MLSRDAMGCVEHDSAHLQVEIANLTLMCGGCAAISRRLQQKKKLRLLVEEADLQPPKAACKNLRARAYGRRQQLTYRLHAHLGLRSVAFMQGAHLLLLLQPATPATRAGRSRVATWTMSS